MDDFIEEEEPFLTKKEKHIIKKGLMVIFFIPFLIYLTGKIIFIIIKRALWNKYTKWCYKKILFFPLKFLQFIGKEIDAFTTLLD